MSGSAVSTPNAKTIGRFQIRQALGHGAQGVVYLAHDPHLDRLVAIKSLAVDARSAERAQRLLEEARTMSKLAHPNIIKVLDAIEHAGNHYLVLEYVEGATVADVLRSKGEFDKFEAVKIAIQVLDGLAYAHGKNIIHCDVKPSNVLLDQQGVAHLMDFGIAAATGEVRSEATGTPQYMAPEYLDNNAAGAAGDIFSLSLVLYEMLTGKPAIAGKNAFEIMHKIANVPIQPPSSLRSDIDERLDDIVMKGLLKRTEDRYSDAAAMQKALADYHAPKPQPSALPDAGSKQRTLDFLLLRMQHKSNFPALSQTISTINRASSDKKSIQDLAAALLRDFALTNKLLRQVNSPAYGQFGGKISTISRAVMILGIEAVRNLAITLILFEHLQNKAQAAELKEEVVMALFNGIMALNIAQTTGTSNPEQGFICGAFHRLGRLLTMYYLHDESVEICNRVRQGMTEENAACAVLGISYEDLGTSVARSWRLPDVIVSSMARIRDPIAKRNTGDAGHIMRGTANLAHELCQLVIAAAPQDRERKLEELRKRYAPAFQLDIKAYVAIIDQSISEFIEESVLLAGDLKKGRTGKAIHDWIKPDVGENESDDTSGTAQQTLENVINNTAALATAEDPPDTGHEAEAILTAGIHDITTTLVGDYNLNDLLRIILETMYRGMGFDHVLLCTRDSSGQRIQARFGFGVDNERLLKIFSFPLDASADVFQIVIEKNIDLFISDAKAESIRDRIPEWHRNNVRSEMFMLLPIAIEGKCIGLLYADCAKSGQLQFQPRHLNLFKTLRNQAVLAIKQKR